MKRYLIILLGCLALGACSSTEVYNYIEEGERFSSLPTDRTDEEKKKEIQENLQMTAYLGISLGLSEVPLYGYEIDDILNIDLGNEELIGINILRKNIKLLISNDAARERIIRSIKLNGGSIVNNIDESTDILVYQPNSEINEILKVARSLNIEVFTLGAFNKRLIINK